MKNSIFGLIVIFCSLAMSSCGGGNDLKDAEGKVVDVESVSDSLITAKLLANGDTLLFKFDEARFTNGMFVSGDSVKIYFIEGRNDTLRAFVVNVIPHTPHYFDPATANKDTLITAPANMKRNKTVVTDSIGVD